MRVPSSPSHLLAKMSTSTSSITLWSCSWSSADPRSLSSPLSTADPGPSPPGTIQEFHLRQSLSDHGGKHQAEEDTAD